MAAGQGCPTYAPRVHSVAHESRGADGALTPGRMQHAGPYFVASGACFAPCAAANCALVNFTVANRITKTTIAPPIRPVYAAPRSLGAGECDALMSDTGEEDGRGEPVSPRHR